MITQIVTSDSRCICGTLVEHKGICPNCGRAKDRLAGFCKQGDYIAFLNKDFELWEYNGLQRIVCSDIVKAGNAGLGFSVSRKGYRPEMKRVYYEEWGYQHGKYYSPLVAENGIYCCPECMEERPVRVPSRFGRCRKCGVFHYYVNPENFVRNELRHRDWVLKRVGDFVDVYGKPPPEVVEAFYKHGRLQNVIRKPKYFIAWESEFSWIFHGPFFMGTIESGILTIEHGIVPESIISELESSDLEYGDLSSFLE